MYLDKRLANRVKGICILLIILGHNKYAIALYHDTFRILYNFHIWAFFFIAACTLNLNERLTKKKIVDLVIKSYVPTLFFIIMTSLSVHTFGINFTTTTLDYAPIFLKGFLFQTAQALRESGAGQVYWFLPAYCTFVIFFVCCANLKKHTSLAVWLALFAVHGYVGSVPPSLAEFIPFGLAPVCYILPLALIAKHALAHALKNPAMSFAVSGVLFWIGTYISVSLSTVVNLGFLILYGNESWWLMVLHDLLAISGFVFIVLSLRSLSCFGWAEYIGQKSLIIFLTHQIFLQAITRIFPVSEQSRALMAILALASTLFAMSGGIFAWMIIHKFNFVKRILFPHSYDEYKTTLSYISHRIKMRNRRRHN